MRRIYLKTVCLKMAFKTSCYSGKLTEMHWSSKQTMLFSMLTEFGVCLEKLHVVRGGSFEEETQIITGCWGYITALRTTVYI